MTRNNRKIEIIILSFLVVVPFLSGLLTVYLMLPNLRKVHSEWLDDEREFNDPLCDEGRIMGLVQKVYMDDVNFNLKFMCTGFILGEAFAILLTECFETEYSQVPLKNLHFITSGSKYWSKNRNIHKIVDWKILRRGQKFTSTENSGSKSTLILLEVDPVFPQSCDYTQNSFYVEETYDFKSEHTLIGWSSVSKTGNVEFVQVPFTKKCIPHIPSAIIFSQHSAVYGFQLRGCTENSEMNEIVVPFAYFIEHLAAVHKKTIEVIQMGRNKRELAQQKVRDV